MVIVVLYHFYRQLSTGNGEIVLYTIPCDKIVDFLFEFNGKMCGNILHRDAEFSKIECKSKKGT